MAAHGWRTGRPVITELFADPTRFDLLQAVRLIEQVTAGAEPVGDGTEPRHEAVRFVSDSPFAFPASTIADLRRREADIHRGAGAPSAATLEGDPGPTVEMAVSFFHLAGLNGPLPAWVADLIRERTSRRDFALKDFLNIFLHRLVSVLVRARRKARLGVVTQPPQDTSFAHYLFSLIGMGTRGLANRQAVPDRALLSFAALLAQRPRSMIGLEILLAGYLEVPVKGQPFVGRWLAIAEDEWTRIGVRGANQGLGQGAVLGRRVWHQYDAFELSLGPLTLARLMDFLPGRPGFKAVCALTRFYTGRDDEVSIRLELAAPEVPRLRLSARGQARLGWTSWLSTRTPPANDRQLVLAARLCRE